MSITVNGVEITEEMIKAQQDNFADASDPRDATIQQLVLHTLLLQKAREAGLDTSDEPAAINALLEQSIRYEPATEATCREFYDTYPERFSQGESAVASHILFPLGDDELAKVVMRGKAEGVLAEVQAEPSRFADLARVHSTCPSGREGGSLGEFGRGQMVKPFEDAVFSTPAGEITPQLVETQFGFHIIQVQDRTQGGAVAFDDIKERLQQYLTDLAARQAMHEYLSGLVDAAKIEGYAMPGL